MSEWISRRTCGSRPVVGSSRKSSDGIVDETHGNGEALFLTAGESGVKGVAFVPKLKALQQVVGVEHAAVESAEEFEGFAGPGFCRGGWWPGGRRRCGL